MSTFKVLNPRKVVLGEEAENIDPSDYVPDEKVNIDECRSEFKVIGVMDEELKKLFALARKYNCKAKEIPQKEEWEKWVYTKRKYKILHFWFLNAISEKMPEIGGKNIYTDKDFRVILPDPRGDYYRHCPGLKMITDNWELR